MTDYSAHDIHRLDQAYPDALTSVEQFTGDPANKKRLTEVGPEVFAAELTRYLAGELTNPMSLAGWAAIATVRLMDAGRMWEEDTDLAYEQRDAARAQVADLADKLHKADAEIRSLEKATTAYANENAALIDELTAVRETVAKAERERALVVEFNSRHLIGTPVRYWKGAREGEGKTSRTRTGAQMLSGHTAVVWVEGEGACIALSHVEPIAAEKAVA